MGETGLMFHESFHSEVRSWTFSGKPCFPFRFGFWTNLARASRGKTEHSTFTPRKAQEVTWVVVWDSRRVDRWTVGKSKHNPGRTEKRLLRSQGKLPVSLSPWYLACGFSSLLRHCSARKGWMRGGVEFGHSIHTHTQVRVSPLSVLPSGQAQCMCLLAQHTHFSWDIQSVWHLLVLLWPHVRMIIETVILTFKIWSVCG